MNTAHFFYPFPPLPEQKKIAEILSTWDKAIEQTRKLIESKKRRTKGLMQQLLTGKKRLPGFSGPWVETRLGNLFCREQRPVALEKGQHYRLVSIRRRAGGLFDRGHFATDAIAYTELHPIQTDDLLISKRQVTHGALTVVDDRFEGAFVSNEYTIFTREKGAPLHMPFFRWVTHRRWVWHLAYVSSDGVHVEKLIFKPRSFLKHSVSLPRCVREQEAIASVLQTAHEEIKHLESQLQAMEKQKSGLMQKLLTGTVRVKP